MIVKTITLLVSIFLLFFLLFLSLRSLRKENNRFKESLSRDELKKALENKELQGFTKFDFYSSLLMIAITFIIGTIIFLGKLLIQLYY